MASAGGGAPGAAGGLGPRGELASASPPPRPRCAAAATPGAVDAYGDGGDLRGDRGHGGGGDLREPLREVFEWLAANGYYVESVGGTPPPPRPPLRAAAPRRALVASGGHGDGADLRNPLRELFERLVADGYVLQLPSPAPGSGSPFRFTTSIGRFRASYLLNLNDQNSEAMLLMNQNDMAQAYYPQMTSHKIQELNVDGKNFNAHGEVDGLSDALALSITKPKLFAQPSLLLSDIGLKTHVYATKDVNSAIREFDHATNAQLIGSCTSAPQVCLTTDNISGGSWFSFLHHEHVTRINRWMTHEVLTCRQCETSAATVQKLFHLNSILEQKLEGLSEHNIAAVQNTSISVHDTEPLEHEPVHDSSTDLKEEKSTMEKSNKEASKDNAQEPAPNSDTKSGRDYQVLTCRQCETSAAAVQKLLHLNSILEQKLEGLSEHNIAAVQNTSISVHDTEPLEHEPVHDSSTDLKEEKSTMEKSNKEASKDNAQEPAPNSDTKSGRDYQVLTCRQCETSAAAVQKLLHLNSILEQKLEGLSEHNIAAVQNTSISVHDTEPLEHEPVHDSSTDLKEEKSTMEKSNKEASKDNAQEPAPNSDTKSGRDYQVLTCRQCETSAATVQKLFHLNSILEQKLEGLSEHNIAAVQNTSISVHDTEPLEHEPVHDSSTDLKEEKSTMEKSNKEASKDNAQEPAPNSDTKSGRDYQVLTCRQCETSAAAVQKLLHLNSILEQKLEGLSEHNIAAVQNTSISVHDTEPLEHEPVHDSSTDLKEEKSTMEKSNKEASKDNAQEPAPNSDTKSGRDYQVLTCRQCETSAATVQKLFHLNSILEQKLEGLSEHNIAAVQNTSISVHDTEPLEHEPVHDSSTDLKEEKSTMEKSNKEASKDNAQEPAPNSDTKSGRDYQVLTCRQCETSAATVQKLLHLNSILEQKLEGLSEHNIAAVQNTSISVHDTKPLEHEPVHDSSTDLKEEKGTMEKSNKEASKDNAQEPAPNSDTKSGGDYQEEKSTGEKSNKEASKDNAPEPVPNSDTESGGDYQEEKLMEKFNKMLVDCVFFAMPQVLIFFPRYQASVNKVASVNKAGQRLSLMTIIQDTDTESNEKTVVVLFFVMFVSVWLLGLVLSLFGHGRRCTEAVSMLTLWTVGSTVAFIDYMFCKCLPEDGLFTWLFRGHWAAMFVGITYIWFKYVRVPKFPSINLPIRQPVLRGWRQSPGPAVVLEAKAEDELQQSLLPV